MPIALGATGTFVALGAAERTAGAYARYLERADVGDMILNPSLNTGSADRAVRALPGVRSVTSDVLLLGNIDDRGGVPRTFAELSDEGAAVSTLGSADGRYSTMDRTILTAGRLPSAADEVLPDGLFPRRRMLLSPELTARYDCLSEVPAPTASEEEALAQMLPPGCAVAYRYYSLDLEEGSRGVPAVQGAFLDAITALNAERSRRADVGRPPGRGRLVHARLHRRRHPRR